MNVEIVEKDTEIINKDLNQSLRMLARIIVREIKNSDTKGQVIKDSTIQDTKKRK